MQATPRRNGFVLLAFGFAMFVIITLALASTTWAAPNGQGTVPTPPTGASATPTTSDGGDNNGGDNNGGDNNNNSNDNTNTGGDNTQQPSPVAPGAGTVCAIGENGAQCAANDLIVVVASGAAGAGSALTIEGSFAQPPCPTSPAGHNFLNRCYRFAWIGTNALPLNAVNAPVQYCISYGAEQLAAVKNNPQNLLIGLANADGNWTLLKPTLATETSRTCATSNQLITWGALFAPQNASELLPTVGGAPNQWGLAALVGVGIVLLMGAAQFRRRAK